MLSSATQSILLSGQLRMLLQPRLALLPDQAATYIGFRRLVLRQIAYTVLGEVFLHSELAGVCGDSGIMQVRARRAQRQSRQGEMRQAIWQAGFSIGEKIQVQHGIGRCFENQGEIRHMTLAWTGPSHFDKGRSPAYAWSAATFDTSGSQTLDPS